MASIQQSLCYSTASNKPLEFVAFRKIPYCEQFSLQKYSLIFLGEKQKYEICQKRHFGWEKKY